MAAIWSGAFCTSFHLAYQDAQKLPSKCLAKSSFHVDPFSGSHVCRDKFISPLSRFFVVFNYSTFVVWPGTFPFGFQFFFFVDFVGLSHLNEMNE